MHHHHYCYYNRFCCCNDNTWFLCILLKSLLIISLTLFVPKRRRYLSLSFFPDQLTWALCPCLCVCVFYVRWLLQKVESVWTAGPRRLRCGGGTVRVTICVTPADSITRWTGRIALSSSPSGGWYVSPTFLYWWHFRLSLCFPLSRKK